MNLTRWFRRADQAADGSAPAVGAASDDRITVGADDLADAQQRIVAALASLSGQLQASRDLWDEPTRAAHQRMQQEWQASLKRMDATIARVRGDDAGRQ